MAATTPTNPGRRRRRHLRFAVVISLILVLVYFTSILPVFRGELQRYLGITDAQFGLFFSLGPLAGAVSVLVGGALVRRLGAVRMIRFGLWGTAVGMLLFAVAGPRWHAALAASVICSACAGPLGIAVSVYLAKLFPRAQRRAFSLNLALVGAGGIVLPVLAEGLLALPGRMPGLTFGHVFRLSFVAVAAVLVAVSFWYRSGRHAAVRRTGDWLPNWRQFILPWPVAWLVGLLCLHGAVDTAIYTWMPKFLAGESFMAHPVVPGLVLAGFSLAYLVSRTILAGLPEAWGRRSLLVLPGLLGGGLLLAGILSRNYWLTAGGYVLGAFCWSAEFPAMMGQVADRGKAQFGAALALQQIAGGPLVAAALYGAGLAVVRVGESGMWLVMAALTGGFLLVGVGGAAWLVLFGRKAGLAEVAPAAAGTAGQQTCVKETPA